MKKEVKKAVKIVEKGKQFATFNKEEQGKISKLLDARKQANKDKDIKEAKKFRRQLRSMGYYISKQGVDVK